MVESDIAELWKLIDAVFFMGLVCGCGLASIGWFWVCICRWPYWVALARLHRLRQRAKVRGAYGPFWRP